MSLKMDSMSGLRDQTSLPLLLDRELLQLLTGQRISKILPKNSSALGFHSAAQVHTPPMLFSSTNFQRGTSCKLL